MTVIIDDNCQWRGREGVTIDERLSVTSDEDDGQLT